MYAIRSYYDLGVRQNFVAGLHRLGLGQQHVVVLLIQILDRIVTRDALGADGVTVQDHHVLLVDGQPVFDAITIQLEQGFAVEGKRIGGVTIVV